MADVNQAVVDEILAKAAEESEEGRLEKLEKEVETLKGSIKRLLLDIREMMNNLENPFQNLQSLTEVSSKSKAPQIQLISAIPEKPEEKKEEKEEKKEEEKLEKEGEVKEPEKEEFKKEEVIAEGGLKEGSVPSVKPDFGKDEGLKMQQIQTEKLETLKKPEIALTKYDIVVLYKLMNWVKSMLEKYDATTLRLMLEVFSIAGYISSEAKEFLHMLTELLSANNGFEDMLLEFYKLHKIMNPTDKTMDSQLLALILEKKL